MYNYVHGSRSLGKLHPREREHQKKGCRSRVTCTYFVVKYVRINIARIQKQRATLNTLDAVLTEKNNKLSANPVRL